MPRPHELTDDALIAQTHEWRRQSLQGVPLAQAQARDHEVELRDRLKHAVARAEGRLASRPSAPPAVPEATTGKASPDCRVDTADVSSDAAASTVSKLLRNVRELLAMDIALVAEFSPDRWICREVDADPQQPSPLHAGWSELRANTYCQRVVEGRLPHVIPDASARPDTGELAITRQLDIGAYLSAQVVLADGTLYGMLCCISRTPRSALGSRQVDALRTVAGLVSREIDRDRRGYAGAGA